MLAGPHLVAHPIWLHSPKCGSGAAEPNYCRDRRRRTGTRITSIATVIGSRPSINAACAAILGSYCSPTSHSMPRQALTPRCGGDLRHRISPRASTRCCNAEIEAPASSARSRSAARRPSRRSSIGRIREDGPPLDRTRRTASLPRRPAAPCKRRRIGPLSGRKPVISNATIDTTIASDVMKDILDRLVTDSSVIVVQFSYGVITNSPLYATNVTKGA